MKTKNKMENFRLTYRDLEMRVHSELRKRIAKSPHISKHTKTRTIKVSMVRFDELTLINEKLTFLDNNGRHFSIFEVTLEDLIEIVL
jgi:hypothetical protein